MMENQLHGNNPRQQVSNLPFQLMMNQKELTAILFRQLSQIALIPLPVFR